MQKWEYHTHWSNGKKLVIDGVEQPDSSPAAGEEFYDLLTAIGEDGWEMVTCKYKHPNKFFIAFKRSKQEGKISVSSQKSRAKSDRHTQPGPTSTPPTEFTSNY